MPQDSLRSVVYRSFVTCDDPKGVVDCGTIRKSKTNSQKMEGKIVSQRTRKNLNTSSEYKEERKEMVSKGITEELHDPSSFQLSEVSRGAQKLNQMLDSWSKGLNFDGQSKDIAKDLLRGALDLQDSLIMLGKLQEASQYMARLKKKQKEKFGGGRVDEVGVEGMDSNQFGDQSYQMGFQKPRLSADWSSRNCTEELKKVIRDGLARQNLLLDTTTEQKAYFDRRKLDSASDIPTTSSSQSSLVYSNNCASSECSPSSTTTPQKKPKGPNLFAKLMGLEEFPSKSLQAAAQKKLESEKVLNQRRPIFDIDMPKARKPQFGIQKVDPERPRTLKEMLETMQYKGLLKGNSVDGFRPHSHHSNASHSKQRLTDVIPPIVIIKPMRFPCPESEEPLAPKFVREEGALDTKEMLRKLKIKEELLPKTIDSKGALNSNEVRRKLEAEETSIKRLSQEEGARKEVFWKLEEKKVKTREKASSNQIKASAPVKPQKKEAIDKKADKIQKVTPNRRKAVLETENAKSKNVSKSHDQAKVTSTKLRKPENGSNITKNQILRQQSTTSNPIPKRTTQTKSLNSGDRKKNPIKHEKPVKKPRAADLVAENLGCKDDDTGINLTCENEPVLIRTNTMLADQLPTEEATDASEIQIGVDCSDSQNSLCEVTLLTTKNESCTKSSEEANDCIGHDETERKCFKSRTNLKDLLLSSPSFLSHAEELFDINVNQPIVSQTTGKNDFGVDNTRLLLDCANELMECKSLRHSHSHSQMFHPLLQTRIANSGICISLGQLVEEVCDGVESLRSYSKLGGENLPMNSIYVMLGRDLMYRGMAIGIWGLGWSNVFSVDEVEQVVCEVEKLVLGGLIEEVLRDFVL